MKLMETIKPFNDLFYVNCYYNALFPVMKYYGIDIVDVLLDFQTEYVIQHNYISMKVKEPSNRVLYFESRGIRTIDVMAHNHEEKDIICKLNSGYPVIVMGDGYYNPVILDLYQKMHWLHAILVIGYEKDEFIMIDHTYRESLNYQLCRVSRNTLMDIIHGYIENFERSYSLPIYSYFLHTEVLESESKCKKNRLKQLQQNTYESLINHKERLLNLIPNNAQEPTIIIEQLLNNLNDCINIKKSYRYICSDVIGQEKEFLNTINDFIACMEQLRNGIAKKYYLEKFDMIFSTYFNQAIEQIIAAEVKLSEQFSLLSI